MVLKPMVEGDLLEMDPDFAEAHTSLFHLYTDRRQFAEARAVLDRRRAILGQTEPSLGDAQLAAAEGRAETARQILAGCERASERQYVSGVGMACVRAVLGDKEAALRHLERAYQDRDGSLAYLKTFAALESLHSDPRYAALMKKLGLPE